MSLFKKAKTSKSSRHKINKWTFVLVPHNNKQSKQITVSKLIPIFIASLLIFIAFILIAILFISGINISNLNNTIKSNKEFINEQKEIIEILEKDNNIKQEQLAKFIKYQEELKSELINLDEFIYNILELVELDPSEKVYFQDIIKNYDLSETNKIIKADSGGSLNSQINSSNTTKEEISEMVLEQTKIFESLIKDIEDRVDYLNARPSIFPLDMSTGSITSNFGYRQSPFSNLREFHYGIDISAPYGTNIVSASDGVVIFSGFKAGYGHTVIISHGYGYETLYSHNHSNLVENGDIVKQGDIIATVGTSGRTTGAHLHFEIIKDGKRINPLNIIKN